jgi:aspartate/methionine/tyrosine aminotransferase
VTDAASAPMLSVVGEGVITRRLDRLLQDTTHPDPVYLGGSPHASLPDHVLDAARSTPALSHYVDSRGTPALREAIATALAEEGFRVSAEQVVVTNGAMHALDVCFGALLTPGAAVATPRPGYFIDGLVRRAGSEVIGIPSPEEADFRPDWDAAERLITPATRILFLNSPVNPTGYVYEDDDLERAWRLANQRDLLIISDESYAHFVYGGRRHRSPLELDPEARRTILVRSFSKDYAMPGWRLGYVVLPRELVEVASAALEWSCLCVNPTAQALGLAALTGRRDWIDDFVSRSEDLGRLTTDAINRIPGLRCPAPKGGLNVLVRYAGDVDALVSESVLRFGVGIQPGHAFGTPGYFRFQFGGSEDAVRTGLERLAAMIESLG